MEVECPVLQEGAKNATINREVEGFQRAFALAVEQEVLSVAPRFKSLPENNARQGFFERADFEALLPRLTLRGKPDTDLQDYLSWCFRTGMRSGETKNLTWADFDRESWTIRLHARDSKNRKGRAIPLENELKEIVERRLSARRLDCPYIFHRHGQRMGEFRKVWKRACAEAGLTGKIPHDFRRSAVRNMVRAGVNPDIARQISGHRIAAIFSRYNIISEADLRDAVQRTSEYVASLPGKSNVLTLAQSRSVGNDR
ncbi:MAG: site-specific integrase [Nitrospira sp. BO4]|nr:site-specific integrase [Nitrospira sp. BO4]